MEIAVLKRVCRRGGGGKQKDPSDLVSDKKMSTHVIQGIWIIACMAAKQSAVEPHSALNDIHIQYDVIHDVP